MMRSQREQSNPKKIPAPPGLRKTDTSLARRVFAFSLPKCTLLLLSCLWVNALVADASAGLQDRLAANLQIATGDTHWPCTFTGKFEQQRSLPGTTVGLTSSGAFMHMCEKGMLWETQQPVIESLVYSYSGTHARFRPGEKIKILAGMVQKRVAELLLALMSGDAAELEHHFKLDLEQSSNAQLILLPRNQAIRQQLQSLMLYSQAGQLQISISAAHGGDTVIKLTEFEKTDLSAVVACSKLSTVADAACKHLFDAAPQ